ncbi:(2Fe-2S)-binding protein [bacterium]|nr:(2Fe-2S)-binding protein [bacterium]NUN44494.1 (2Fe-2S)-binding protein [bacterium]
MITRCVCFDKEFEELKKVAAAYRCKTLEELQERVLVGVRCKLCHPYIRRMLATGQTRFEVNE